MIVEWILPTYESRVRNEEYIKYNAKYHCFVSDIDKEMGYTKHEYSLCKRHLQTVGFYEYLNSKQALENPEIVCKSCLKKYKKMIQDKVIEE